MNRRLLLNSFLATALAGAAPLRAQSRPLRVAWVFFSTAAEGSPFLDEVRSGLRAFGYVEGRNVTLDAYWADDSLERLPGVVAQMLATSPDIIVAQGIAVSAVYEAKPRVPVVFGFSGDVIEAGFVKTYAHPGGNMTGISFLALELVGKRFEMLRAVMPSLKRVAVLAAPQHPGDKAERRASDEAAAALGISTVYFEARNAKELQSALGAIEKAGCEAVVMFPVQYVITYRRQIAEWAIRNRLPTVSGWAQFADGGNLMSYGPNLRECAARMAFFVDKIAKGARPGDIPVELPKRVEFVLNLKAAKALAVTVPPAVVLRADRVIE